MSKIPPIDDSFIDGVIRSAGPYNPNNKKTQGAKLRELLKLLRDRMEEQVAETKATSQSEISTKADAGDVVYKTTQVNGKTLSSDVSLTSSDVPEGSNLYYSDSRVDGRIEAQKGEANGLAPLDETGKLSTSYLPESILGSVTYKGTYNPATNTPVLPSASASKGWYYIIAANGSHSGVDFRMGDWIISDGAYWQKVDNNNNVTSVAGKVGAVSLVKGDVGLSNVDNTSDVNKPISTAVQAALNLKAIDSNVVHKTGDETISGAKYFRDKLSVLNDINASNIFGNTIKTYIDFKFDAQSHGGFEGFITAPTLTTSTQWRFPNKGGDIALISDLTTKANTNGSNATGTWGINITGNAGNAKNSAQWNSQIYNGALSFNTAPQYVMGYDLANTEWKPTSPEGLKLFLGLGANAYESKNNLSQFANDLGNYGGWLAADGASYAGFASGDVNYPYMRFTSTSEVVRLARYDQLGSFASRNSITGSEVVTNQSDAGTDIGTAQMLRWKNYGNNHVIFDASQGTAPNGVAVDSTNPTVYWSGTYPTLMGWNGTYTYGVRVDSARIADSTINWGGLVSNFSSGVQGGGITSILGVHENGTSYGFNKPAVQNWLGLGSGAYNDKTKLWSTTHVSDFYLFNEWDGTYWQLKSNHSSPINVGHANVADTAKTSQFLQTPYTYPNNIITDATAASTLADGSVTSVAMHGSHGLFGGYATTLTMSGYDKWGAIQISAEYNPHVSRLAVRNFTQQTNDWTQWNELVTFNNVSSSGGANQIVQRDVNGYIHNNYFNTSSGGAERNSSGMGYFAGFNTGDYYIRSYTADAVKSLLGIEGINTSKTHREHPTFGVDANTVEANTSSFTYAVNAPYNGFLGHFGNNGYGLQLNGQYGNGARLAFRQHNGDGPGWSAWRELLWSGYDSERLTIGAGMVIQGGSGTAYNTADLEVRSYNRRPVIGLHWGNVVASTITVETSGRVAIMNNPGTGYEALVASNIYSSINMSADGYVTGSRLWAGWDSGVAGAVSASNWFRASGNTGLYNQTYGTHIYSAASNSYDFATASTDILFRLKTSDDVIRGYIHANNSNEIGFLKNDGSWGLRVASHGYVYASSLVTDNWFRSTGASGWHNDSYGGGIYMTDSSWVRVYGGKNFVCDNEIQAGIIRATTGDGFLANTYGIGLTGVYSAYRYQNVFSMGTAYKPATDGTALNDMYGIAWTHSNIGGQSRAGLGHQALFVAGGVTQTAIGDGIWTRNEVSASKGFVVQSNNGDGYGLNLYEGSAYRPTYGLMFGITSTFGTHGSVNADWATYFTMNGTAGRGWIFRNQDTNARVASISIEGNATFNGSVTAATGFYDTSDSRLKILTDDLFDARSIKARTYYKNNKLQTGYFAQDVQAVMPHTVDDSGNYLTLSYTQVLVAKISNLEDDIKELQLKLKKYELE